jgi:hypothetical protein
MEPNFNAIAYDLRTIALLNPRLALMLSRGQPWAPRTYNIELRWDTPASEYPIEQHLNERLYQDCWISDIVYTVDAANVAVGSTWKPMIEQAYVQSAGNWILLDMRVEGPDRFQMTNEFTPMAAICSHNSFQQKLLDKAWVIGHDQNLFVKAINTRAFDVHTEVPTVVRLTLCVKELSGCNLRSIGYDEAVCALRDLDILPVFPPKKQ